MGTLNMGGTLAPTNPPGGIAGTGIALADVSAHKDAPPPPPETFGAYGKKSEESGGVLAMMDLLVKGVDKEMTEAEVEEEMHKRITKSLWRNLRRNVHRTLKPLPIKKVQKLHLRHRSRPYKTVKQPMTESLQLHLITFKVCM